MNVIWGQLDDVSMRDRKLGEWAHTLGSALRETKLPRAAISKCTAVRRRRKKEKRIEWKERRVFFLFLVILVCAQEQ